MPSTTSTSFKREDIEEAKLVLADEMSEEETNIAVADATASTCVAKATRVALATHVRRCSFSYSDKYFASLRLEG